VIAFPLVLGKPYRFSYQTMKLGTLSPIDVANLPQVDQNAVTFLAHPGTSWARTERGIFLGMAEVSESVIV